MVIMIHLSAMLRTPQRKKEQISTKIFGIDLLLLRRTQSLTASVYEFRHEGGRRFHVCNYLS